MSVDRSTGPRWLHACRTGRKPQRMVFRPRILGDIRAICTVARHASSWRFCASLAGNESHANYGASCWYGQCTHALHARWQLPEQSGKDRNRSTWQGSYHNLPHPSRQNPRTEGNLRRALPNYATSFFNAKTFTLLCRRVARSH